jgi:hypothetical protein
MTYIDKLMMANAVQENVTCLYAGDAPLFFVLVENISCELISES